MDWQAAGMALLGGVMIGAAAVGLLVLSGRTAGISGILDGVLRLEKHEFGWKAAFVAGLVVGGIVLVQLLPENVATHGLHAWPILATAGLLVGYGTRLGGGCTSGHGVCGIARLNARSIVGTLIFIATGAITVIVMREVA